MSIKNLVILDGVSPSYLLSIACDDIKANNLEAGSLSITNLNCVNLTATGTILGPTINGTTITGSSMVQAPTINATTVVETPLVNASNVITTVLDATGAVNFSGLTSSSSATPIGVDGSNNVVKINNSINTLYSSSTKEAVLTSGQYTNVASYSASSGRLKKLWVAVSGNAMLCWIRIRFDGVTTVGSDLTSGWTNANSLSLSVLLTADMGSTSSSSPNGLWSSDYSGCSSYNGGGGGGYITFDNAWFNSSFEVDIYFNNGSSNGNYWCQAFYTKETPTNSLRLHGVPFQFLAPVSFGLSTYSEMVMANIAAGSNTNGAFISSCKCFYANGSGNSKWFEGEFNIYQGCVSATQGSTEVYATSTANTLTYWNQQAGVTTLLKSTGTEDFALNSYNWSFLTLYATKNVGTVYLTGSGGNGDVVMYRYFDFDSMPGVSAGNSLTMTWTLGNQIADFASSYTGQNTITSFYGYVFYYT